MAKLIQIFLGVIKVKDKTCKTIIFKCQIHKSNTSVKTKNDIVSLTNNTKVLFPLTIDSFPDIP